MIVLNLLLTWVIVPIIIFVISFQLGLYQQRHIKHVKPPCETPEKYENSAGSSSISRSSQISKLIHASEASKIVDHRVLDHRNLEVYSVDPDVFLKHRFDYMGKIPLVSTLILQEHGSKESDCDRYIEPLSWISRQTGSNKINCLAVVRTDVPASQPVIRFKPPMPNLNDPGADGHGFFTKVTISRSRTKTAAKFRPFVENFDSLDTYVKERLSSRKFHDRGVKDLVVMVVNAGELDLFMNLACSAHKHGISLENFVVFAGSKEIVPIIEYTGALGLYHTAFASVSKVASHDYLDFTFVDMMWYKCFSIYMILREGFNILFQDVDLVWFRDPFPFFHELLSTDHDTYKGQGVRPLDALLSDDGQRSLRYTPFFANSGFYYLRSNPEMINFAWSVMTSFPMIQRLGSQQNMYTMRLLESMTNFGIRSLFLNITDFPNGYLYHHGKGYMDKFNSRAVKPYNFHMCWTQGKKDKLKYLKKSGMWYVKPGIERLLMLREIPFLGKKSWDGVAEIMCGGPEGWM
jgi:hypothetical protein